MNNKRPWYKRHRDDEWYDEVRIKIVPRFKTSDLSGDEWRVSAHVQLLRKGVVLGKGGYGNLDYATKMLAAFIVKVSENGFPDSNKFDGFCFQPGCSEQAISEYRLKKEFCNEGHGHEPEYHDARRRFCLRHLRRGDGGLEDADDNYEVISGPGPDSARGYAEDISPSARVDVAVKTPEDIPQALAEVRKEVQESEQW